MDYKKKYTGLLLIVAFVVTCSAFLIFKKHFVNRTQDMGDAPIEYGIARHYKPEQGPYFGRQRGNDFYPNLEQDFDFPFAFSSSEDGKFFDKDDAFVLNGQTENLNSIRRPVFAPEIYIENQTYIINVPLNGAQIGDPVSAWIDFDNNYKFDDNEKAKAYYKGNNVVTLTWRLPLQLQTCLTVMRLRTCRKVNEIDIEIPTGDALTGEVEDFPVRMSSIVVPNFFQKDSILFKTASNNFTSIAELEQEVSTYKLASANIKFKLAGQKPDIFGINALHDASVLGIRLGHESDKIITRENPIVLQFEFSQPVNGLSFQIIDIDGGDAFCATGYSKGLKVAPKVHNISDNYFYQYSTASNWLFGDPVSDAGGTDFIPSSLDMGATVNFEQGIDSLEIRYADFSPSTSGTFTLGNITARKFNNSPASASKPVVVEKMGKGMQLTWNLVNPQNVKNYTVLRSYDSKTYEIIGKSSIENAGKTSYEYFDNAASTNAAIVFYKIALQEKDDNITESPTVRFKRLLSQSLLGFKSLTGNFLNKVELQMLKDMNGEVVINMYNYATEKVKVWNYKDLKKDNRFVLNDLGGLPPSIYYLEMVNNGQKYLFEVSNNNAMSRVPTKEP
jgi:GEVED domain